MISRITGILASSRDSGGYDPDAQAFITAVGTLTTAQEIAINDLVLAMKSAGVWAKGIAYYPMVGGSASAHKWNLFDPRDLDAAFRGVFVGGWTHNTNGAQGNGTTGALNTFVIPNTHLTENSVSMVYSSGTSASINKPNMGTQGNASIPSMTLYIRFGGVLYSDMHNYSTGRTSGTVASGDDVFINSRTASNVHKVYKGGSQVGSTNTGAAMPGGYTFSDFDEPIAISAIRNFASSIYDGYNSAVCNGSGIFTGMSDTEVSDLSTAINNFNTALSR